MGHKAAIVFWLLLHETAKICQKKSQSMEQGVLFQDVREKKNVLLWEIAMVDPEFSNGTQEEGLIWRSLELKSNRE